MIPREKSEYAKRTQPAPVPAVLAPRQVLAVRLLMVGMGVTDAAREVGVCRHTIRRWMKMPAFVAEARRQAAAVAASRKPPPRL
jgi:transposase-like protein